MTSFSFLHAADIHLDSPLTGLSRYEGVPADLVRRAPRAAFDQLIQTAIERQVAFVVIAGDLYDGDWKDAGTGLYFAAAMGRLDRAGIPLYLLKGNHDAASEISRQLPAPANVHSFSDRKAQTHLIPHLGVALHGRGFAERSAAENLAQTYPDPVAGAFNIGVLHTSLAGHAEHETYAPCTAQELAARGYHYWALGHVHEHRVIGENPHIVFPGNLQGRHIREDGPRGAVLVHVQHGEVSRLERLELDVVRWWALSVATDGIAHLDGLHEAIRAALCTVSDHGRPTVVRLTLTGRSPLHGALQDPSLRLRDDVRGIAAELGTEIWIEKLRIKTAPAAQSAPAASDFGALIPLPDDTLAKTLQEDFKKFLSGMPQDLAGGSTDHDGSLLRQARHGEWTDVMRAAHAALLHRLEDAA